MIPGPGDPLWAVIMYLLLFSRHTSPGRHPALRTERDKHFRGIDDAAPSGAGQKLYAATLRRTATVMGQRGNVVDFGYLDAGAINGTDCRFATVTGTHVSYTQLTLPTTSRV